MAISIDKVPDDFASAISMIFVKTLSKIFLHGIFREKWTVAAGRIKFSKCVFAVFIFREIFSENHRNRPNAKSSGLGPDISAPESAETALFAKVCWST